jgi:hypothetical protein
MHSRWRRLLLAMTALLMGGSVLLSSRLAPGTVSEQRARLPPPAVCGDDPVIGYWRSHQFLESDEDWTEFTLEIHRAGDAKDGRLVGKIFNHSWQGGPEREQPGECGPEQLYRVRVSLEAVGEVKDGQIRFEGTSWKMDEMVCGRFQGEFRYFLDRFTGTVDPERQEFQSVNNDGGRMVNHPTVFRRVRCFSDGPPPNIVVKPPPLYPKDASSCNCSLGACG